MIKKINEDQLEELGWTITKMRLDQELPVRKRRRFFYWLLLLLITTLAAGWYFADNSLSVTPPIQTQKTSKSIDIIPIQDQRANKQQVKQQENPATPNASAHPKKDKPKASSKHPNGFEESSADTKTSSPKEIKPQTTPQYFAQKERKERQPDKSRYGIGQNSSPIALPQLSSSGTNTPGQKTRITPLVSSALIAPLTPILSPISPPAPGRVIEKMNITLPVISTPTNQYPHSFVLSLSGQYNPARNISSIVVDAGIMKKWKDKYTFTIGAEYTIGLPTQYSYITEVPPVGRRRPYTEIVEEREITDAAGLFFLWNYLWNERWSWGILSGFRVNHLKRNQTKSIMVESGLSQEMVLQKRILSYYSFFIPEYYAGIQISRNLSRHSSVKVNYQLSSLDIKTRNQNHSGDYIGWRRWLPGKLTVGCAYTFN